ncbi:cell division protein FtsQ/DivIB [Ferruginibacter sp. SUN002]|uniref:cell division protein FtsQ/DivIB n=1 Tax=Ferruginibacter sp. SUN002 TaxID=2937789 RepID=UPI003D35FE17
MINKQAIVKWLTLTLWVSVGIGIVILLVAAIQKKDAKHCSQVNIYIKGVSNNAFVDEKDIRTMITTFVGGDPQGKAVSFFNLRAMEGYLKKNIWVKSAELFFDNNQVLQVNVVEREPMARVFTTTGSTFYIDDSVAMLPLSEKFSARLPVFTNFPSDNAVLSKADSNLLRDVLNLSLAIQKDSFAMSMIDQVDITVQRTFLLVPKIGEQMIVFGDASNAEEKLAKMKLFYKDAMTKAGWDYYSEINLQFKDQVVAKRKGAEDIAADSARALQLMQLIAANAEKQSADSMQLMLPDNDPGAFNDDLILQSREREEAEEAAAAAAENNAVSPAAALSKPLPLKAVVGKPATTISAPVKKATADKSVPTVTTKQTTTKPIVKQSTDKKVIKPVVKPISKPQVKPAVPKKTGTTPANDY